MSTNTELQALLTKMGGTPTEQDTNSDLIKKINEVYEAGGSGGGSSQSLIVTETVTEEPNPEDPESPVFVHTLDKTWKEIHDAILGNTIVIYRYVEDDYTFENPNTFIERDGSSYMVFILDYNQFSEFISFETETETGYPSYKDYGK